MQRGAEAPLFHATCKQQWLRLTGAIQQLGASTLPSLNVR